MNEIQKHLADGVSGGVFTAASFAFGRLGKPILKEATGKTRSDSRAKPVVPETLFDLASLTKVLFTTTVIARWVDQKHLSLEVSLVELLPALPWNAKWKQVSLRDVLYHCAGFESWKDFTKTLRPIVDEIAILSPVYSRGTETRYSDLGFILLGSYLNSTAQKSLSKILEEEINRWLNGSAFRPSPLDSKLKEEAPATEENPERGGIIQGEVYDSNAWKLGGLAGHAGLFGTAEDCVKIGLLWLEAVLHGNSFLSRKVAKEFAKLNSGPKGEPRALGWACPSLPGSAGGNKISPNSIGHLGYTGTSIWIDIEREAVAVLLTNRTYPTATNEKIRVYRPQFHDTVWEYFEE